MEWVTRVNWIGQIIIFLSKENKGQLHISASYITGITLIITAAYTHVFHVYQTDQSLSSQRNKRRYRPGYDWINQRNPETHGSVPKPDLIQTQSGPWIRIRHQGPVKKGGEVILV